MGILFSLEASLYKLFYLGSSHGLTGCLNLYTLEVLGRDLEYLDISYKLEIQVPE